MFGHCGPCSCGVARASHERRPGRLDAARGTPREGESLTACARRELLEETGISADLSRVALVVESVPPESSRRMLDIVFATTGPVLGREHSREPGLEPHFVSPDQLAELNLHPSLAVRPDGIIDPGSHGYAPYVGNIWRLPVEGAGPGGCRLRRRPVALPAISALTLSGSLKLYSASCTRTSAKSCGAGSSSGLPSGGSCRKR